MKRDLLKPTADVVFKRIFGQEKEITIEFINLFVEPPLPVIDITYLQQEMLSDIRDGKISVVDIRCTDTNNQHFILEMQVVHHEGFLNRQLLYACKAYALQYLSGEKYNPKHPVFLLTIVDHEILPGVADWNHKFSFNHQTYPEIMVEGISLRFIELAKRRKMDNFNMDIPTDRWLKFLAEPEKLITMQKFDISVYPNLLKATELLDRSQFTIEQQIAYDRHWFAMADINQSNIDSYDKGYDEGETKGEKRGVFIGIELSISIVQELKKGDLTPEQIAEKFSISLEMVQKLAGEI